MSSKYCEYCGAAMQPEDLFCPSCGQKISDNNVEKVLNDNESSGSGHALVTQQETRTELERASQTPVYQAYPHQAQTQPQRVPVQQFFSAQPSVQSNPFTRFSEEMNTEKRPKKTMGRGMVLSGIIAMVVFAFVITGVMLAGHKPAAKKHSPPDSVAAQQGQPTDFDKSEILADIENIKKEATLSEIAGNWKGEMQLIRMDGYDSLPADELPPNFKEIIAQAMATPAPMTLEIEDDGNWEIDVAIIEGIRMGSNEYDRNRFQVSPLLISALKEGRFEVVHNDTAEGAAMQIRLSGTVTEESNGLAIQGVFMLSMKRGKTDAVMEGRYIINPVA